MQIKYSCPQHQQHLASPIHPPQSPQSRCTSRPLGPHGTPSFPSHRSPWTSSAEDQTPLPSPEPEVRPVALITGAAQGIGLSIAQKLWSDGYSVVLNDLESHLDTLEDVCSTIRCSPPSKRQLHTYYEEEKRCEMSLADVSKEDEVREMIDGVVGAFGGLDIMIANAGVVGVFDLVDTPVGVFDATYNVNVRGTFLCYKYAGMAMIAQAESSSSHPASKRRRKGRIIGACSNLGKQGARGFSAYSASKFAIRGLTQSAALEFAPYGITVNAYAAGAIQTPMLDSLSSHYSKTKGVGTDEYWNVLKARIPLGHVGKPEDIANMVSWLVSEEGGFVTGQSISCNGGLFFD